MNGGIWQKRRIEGRLGHEDSVGQGYVLFCLKV